MHCFFYGLFILHQKYCIIFHLPIASYLNRLPSTTKKTQTTNYQQHKPKGSVNNCKKLVFLVISAPVVFHIFIKNILPL